MAQELKRVTKYVVEFVQRALRDDKEFTARDLRLYVSLQLGAELASAPASADRIMRDQRKKGNINYELVSRAKSLYRALPVVVNAEEAQYKADEAAAIERKLDVTVPPAVEYVTYYGSDVIPLPTAVGHLHKIAAKGTDCGPTVKKSRFWSW